jgi:hypothetical protein
MCTLKNRGQRRGETSSILGPIITDLLIIFMKFNYSDTQADGAAVRGEARYLLASADVPARGADGTIVGLGTRGEGGQGEGSRGEKRSEERREQVCRMSGWSFRFKADIPLVAESPGLDCMASF